MQKEWARQWQDACFLSGETWRYEMCHLGCVNSGIVGTNLAS